MIYLDQPFHFEITLLLQNNIIWLFQLSYLFVDQKKTFKKLELIVQAKSLLQFYFG